jgi:hypothetical protein
MIVVAENKMNARLTPQRLYGAIGQGPQVQHGLGRETTEW